MLFISHTHSDKEIVEPIAARLAKIYGQEQIFYDSWSIQPGDSILGRMEDGLKTCMFFLLFISKASLDSKMVEIEWKNGLIKRAREGINFIPVILDNANIPYVLSDLLYINFNNIGMDVTVKQLVNVINGNNTYRSRGSQLTNLEANVYLEAKHMIRVECIAKHCFEPISSFVFVVDKEKDINISLGDLGHAGSCSTRNFKFPIENKMLNSWALSTLGGLVKGFPLVVRIYTTSIYSASEVEFNLKYVLHERERDKFIPIPINLKN